jgi:hypothetical protein
MQMGINLKNSHIHPCHLGHVNFIPVSGHTYLSLFSYPVGAENAAQLNI